MWGVVGAWKTERKVVRNDVREMDKIQILWGLIVYDHEFGLCFICIGIPLVNFKQSSNKISFMP